MYQIQSTFRGIFIFSTIMIFIATLIEKTITAKHESRMFDHEINENCDKCEAFEESVANMIAEGGNSDTTISIKSESTSPVDIDSLAGDIKP